MPSRINTAASVASIFLQALRVSAHGHVTEVTIGDEAHYGHDPTKVPWGPQPDSITWTNGAHDNGFVPASAPALASPDIICHLDAENGLLTAPVKAGSNITLTWNDWPHAHWGPVLDYMARCENDDCTTVDKESLNFFKIAHMGQIEMGVGGGQAGYWANNKLRDEDFSWTIEIPEKLAPGEYVLRHEIIALHAGGGEGSTQMYPQCVNLVVEGDGDVTPEGIPATELYTAQDEGIMYNVYSDEWREEGEYQIPGPPVFEF